MAKSVEDLQKIIEKIVRDRGGDLDRLIRLKSQYYNLISNDQLPTNSKIPFPFAFAMVEENIPAAMDYLFPNENPVRLEPEEGDIDIEALQRAEWGLHQMITRRMDLEKQCSYAVVDCFKVGVGYTITEPYTITPFVSTVSIAANEKRTVRKRTMERDRKERRAIRERHLNVGQVLGHKDGSDTNGSKRSSTVICLEFYTEAQVKNMSEKMGDRPGGTLMDAYSNFKSNYKDGQNVHQSISSWIGKIKELDGPEFVENPEDEALPILIPVVKVYMEDYEAWLAFGEHLVFEVESEYQTLRCPITKWSAIIDGDMWYSYSVAEAMEKPHLATNIWINMVYDMMTWVTNRPMVYDKETFPDGPPAYDLREQYGVSGHDNVGNAVAFLDAPNISSDTFAVGDRLDAMSEKIKGKRDLTQRNFTRGGANAFQDLISSVTGRERIAGRILEMGALREVITNVLIEMQLMGEDLSFNYRETDSDGADGLNTKTVTSDDLNHAYSVTLNLKDKFSTGSMSVADRFAMYDRMKEDDYVDPVELRRFAIGSADLAHRLLKPKNQAKTIETQNRNASLLERATGVQRRVPAQAPAQLGAEV